MASSLFHIMSMGSESLANARLGVDVTGHNISNAHTEGYSRQRVNISTKPPVQYGLHVLGNGAKVDSISRMHDQYLEGYIRKEMQTNGAAEAITTGLERLEELFNPELTATVRQRMDTFQNSLREFANFPEDPSVRTNVVESGNALAQSVNITHSGILGVQRDLSNEVADQIKTLNTRLTEVSGLNSMIKALQSGGREANDLLDKRDELIKQIGQTVDIQVYNDQNDSLVIRGAGGELLVDGSRNGQFKTSDGSGLVDKSKVYFLNDPTSAPHDVTKKIEGGRIAGMLKVRDQYAQRVRDELNTLASGFGESFNEIHRRGFGVGEFSELDGRNFFEGTNHEDPAAAFRVNDLILAEPNAVAAAMSGLTSGDNVIANDLVRLFKDPIFDDGKISVADYYDRLVGNVGIDSMRAQEEFNASKIVMSQLDAQREATAGVSLDEEAANLLKYQHLFAASSRVITTVDQMLETILGLKR